MLEVCFCEPFIISGVLPTLGVSTLKAALDEKDISSKIYYPSIDFFMRAKMLQNKKFSELLEDIPLQIAEIIFCNDIFENLSFHKEDINDELKAYISKLNTVANEILKLLIKEIVKENPKIFCYSYTFGGYNFTQKLFRLLKKEQPNVKIVVGGSNCTPDFSQALLREFLEIDYVICDESIEAFVLLVEKLLNKTENNIPHVSTRENIAAEYQFIQDMDKQPCPNFDDYFEIIKKYNISREYITLPYEISRGCWWCERKPCRMCGFFGNRKKYILKSSSKVIKELHYLNKRYGVDKFRFSDLVQPKKNYLEQLQVLSAYDMKFFYEIRPDVSEEELFLLRNMGVTFAQIGIESLNTKQLQYMNKGTTGIYNIYILLLCSSYKIDVIWNYLYGFEEEEIGWYEEVVEIIPYLYHLQPPIARRVWINKYSEEYYELERSNDSFFEFQTIDFQTFFKITIREEFVDLYEKLCIAIECWREEYNHNCGLYIDVNKEDYIKISRIGRVNRVYELVGVKARIYNFFMKPRSMEEAVKELNFNSIIIKSELDKLIEDKLILNLDEKYLSLATKNTRYKYTKSVKQVLYLDEKIYN